MLDGEWKRLLLYFGVYYRDAELGEKSLEQSKLQMLLFTWNRIVSWEKNQSSLMQCRNETKMNIELMIVSNYCWTATRIENGQWNWMTNFSDVMDKLKKKNVKIYSTIVAKCRSSQLYRRRIWFSSL